jgi:hypothetical protein
MTNDEQNANPFSNLLNFVQDAIAKSKDGTGDENPFRTLGRKLAEDIFADTFGDLGTDKSSDPVEDAEHAEFHKLGLDANVYPVRSYSVEAIEYIPVEYNNSNVVEVVKFMLAHDISFAFNSKRGMLVGASNGQAFSAVLNAGDFLVYRRDLGLHQILTCTDFAANFGLPMNRAEVADDEFEDDTARKAYDETINEHEYVDLSSETNPWHSSDED